LQSSVIIIIIITALSDKPGPAGEVRTESGSGAPPSACTGSQTSSHPPTHDDDEGDEDDGDEDDEDDDDA